MRITYAGFPLVLPDPDGRVQEWFDDWLPQSDMRMISEWPQPTQNISGPPYYSGTRLPMPNYSRPQRVKLDSWYVPVGAARWAFGYFLADYGTVQNITAAIGTNTAPQPLVLEAPDGHIRTWGNAYLLPPHPVSTQANDPNGVWILPIVDDRWYWQFTKTSIVSMNGATPTTWTWAGLYDLLASFLTPLGIGFSIDTVPATYLYPNMFFIGGTTHHNLGILLDAVAHSVGQRIVAQYAGGTFAGAYRAVGWATSRAIRATNLAAAGDVGALQVGVFAPYPAGAAGIPASVTVIFRGHRDGIVLDPWQKAPYTSQISAATAGQPGGVYSNNSYPILSTALADISAGGNIAAPDNQATLDALATQIATDYYAGLWIQDSDVVGVSQWAESGFDDYVEFNMGRPDYADGFPRTRIHSRPYNEIFERMLHYDSTTWEYGERISGTLDGTLTAGGSQTITLGTIDGCKPTGTTHLKVTSIVGTTGIAGDKIEAFRFNDVWGVNGTASASGALVIYTGSTSAMVLAGATGTFTLDMGGGTVTATVNQGICFASPDPSANTIKYLVGLMADGSYQVLNPTRMFLAYPPTTQTDPGGTATMTILSGTLGSEGSTATTISVYCRDAAIVKNGGSFYPIYKIIVTPQNTYEALNTTRFFSCTYISGGGAAELFCTAPNTGVAVTMSEPTAGNISAVLTHGRVRTGRSYLVGGFDHNGQAKIGGVCMQVIDPSLEVEGTAAANIASGATGNITTTIGNTLSCYNALALQVNISTNVKAIWRAEAAAAPFWAIVGNG